VEVRDEDDDGYPVTLDYIDCPHCDLLIRIFAHVEEGNHVILRIQKADRREDDLAK